MPVAEIEEEVLGALGLDDPEPIEAIGDTLADAGGEREDHSASDPAPAKRRGRPRGAKKSSSKPEEVDAKPADVPLPSSPKKGRGKIDESIVNLGVCAMFGGIGAVTHHPQIWAITPAEAKPISEPLTQLLNQLPAATLKKLEKHLPALMLAYGCTVVAGPRVLWELETRKLEAQLRADKPAARNTEGSGEGRRNGAQPSPTYGETSSPPPHDLPPVGL